MNPRYSGLFAVLAAGLLLAGCTAAPLPTPVDTETYLSDTAAPEDPEVTPNPVEPDTTLIVRAVATASNGAKLSLELQVHQSVRWDDVPNQTLPAAVAEDCAGALTPEIFAAQSWSFTRATLTAIPGTGESWPETDRIDLLPSASAVYTSGRGILAHDSADGTPLCQQLKYLTVGGRGGIAVAIAGDAGSFVGWAGHRFGFASSNVALSDCSFELTSLGSSLLGGASWVEANSATSCVTGPETETAQY